jgi:drug/metabolite transporter (DMT)-like permease
MFRGQGLAKPQIKSLVGALGVIFLVMLGSQTSAVIGYVLALSALVMIIVAMHMESIWPKQSRKENSLVFSLFWGLMIGAVVPFLVTTFLEGGASAVYEVFTSQP